jgi:hypothetical protein
MSDEDRSMILIGRGIGDRPVFKPHQRDPTMSSLPKYRIAAPHTKWNVRKWKRAENSNKMCGYTSKNVNVKRKRK